MTFHENSINEHGWSGYGYSIVDPETGVGGYLIEGKGNGAVLLDGALNLASVIQIWGYLIKGKVAMSALSMAILPYISIIVMALLYFAFVLMLFGFFDPDCGGSPYCDATQHINMIAASASSIKLMSSSSVIGVLIGFYVFVMFMKGKYAY